MAAAPRRRRLRPGEPILPSDHLSRPRSMRSSSQSSTRSVESRRRRRPDPGRLRPDLRLRRGAADPDPGQGRLLTALSLWWFGQLADLVPHHVISATDVPAEFAGRAIRCRRLDMVPSSASPAATSPAGPQGVRAHRRGLRRTAAAGPGRGVACRSRSSRRRPRRRPGSTTSRSPSPRWWTRWGRRPPSGCARSPSTSTGGVRNSPPTGASWSPTPRSNWASAPDGTLVLADEVLTSDSSRYWPADEWQPGRTQFSYDKQYVRDWSAGLGWDRPRPDRPSHGCSTLPALVTRRSTRRSRAFAFRMPQ